METIRARNVVVGAGVAGSAAAYHLARRGEPVLLLDRFPPGHARGSSHGASRIIRHSYADVNYARLMPRAYRLWHELEAEAGTPLLTRTGGVSASPPGCDYVDRVAASLAELGVAHGRMTGEEWNGANPSFRAPADAGVVFEPDAGMLAASKCLSVLRARCLRGGVEERRGSPIDGIDLESTRPVLVGDGVRIEAERVIVAAGSWASRLLPGLGSVLTPTRQRVLYFRADDPVYGVGRLPVFIWLGAEAGDAYYGMPDVEGRGVKVARHFGPPTNPDVADEAVDEAYVETVRGFLRGFLPGLARAPVAATETCLYTMAPGEEFLVGAWPGRGDVLVASACSGHGFKFGILVGEVLADLATGATPAAGTERWGASLSATVGG
jgi:sarcosine oxidase